MCKLIVDKRLYTGQIVAPRDFYECQLFTAEHNKKCFIPRCPDHRAFQRKGLMNLLGIFRL